MTAATSIEEGDLPSTDDNLEMIPAKIGAIQFRIHGILDRMLAAVKNLAALILRMESRIPRGPMDYETPIPAQPYVVYGGHIGTPPAREPSWQKYALGIVAVVVGLGIPSIGGILWSMNTKLEQQAGQTNLTIQRLDQVDAHLKATDQRVDVIERELWPHKH
jgi:hypothetical protein